MNRSFATAVTVAMFWSWDWDTKRASPAVRSRHRRCTHRHHRARRHQTSIWCGAVELGGGTDLAGGTYVVDDPFPVHISVEVPEGWSSCGLGARELGVCADGIGAIGFLIVDNVVGQSV